MENPVKIAVIGGSYGTKVSLPVLSHLPEFDPAAIWSRRAERGRELAADAGAPPDPSLGRAAPAAGRLVLGTAVVSGA